MTYRLLATNCGAGPCPAVHEEACGIGMCPGVHEGRGDELLAIGTKVEVVPEELKEKIGPEETVVAIPRSVLFEAARKPKL